MDALDAIGAARLGVDLRDQVGQHCVPDRTLRRRPLAALVEAGLRHPRTRQATWTGRSSAAITSIAAYLLLGWSPPRGARPLDVLLQARFRAQ